MKKKLNQFFVLPVAIMFMSMALALGCAPMTKATQDQQTPAIAKTQALPKLKVSNITFNNNYRGPGSEGKPEDGFYAAKWWKGKPQVMCYKNASRDKLPAASLQVIIDHLSANRPATANELADENFARHEFIVQ